MSKNRPFLQIVVKSKRKDVFEVQKLRFVITLKNFVDIFRVGETRKAYFKSLWYMKFSSRRNCMLNYIEII